MAGSAIQAFEEVCPERIDLIHRNYRKLCSLLVDVEEWGQVVIINMLARYSRTQFLNPNAAVRLARSCDARNSRRNFNFAIIIMLVFCDVLTVSNTGLVFKRIIPCKFALLFVFIILSRLKLLF